MSELKVAVMTGTGQYMTAAGSRTRVCARQASSKQQQCFDYSVLAHDVMGRMVLVER